MTSVPNPVLAVMHEPTMPASYPGHMVLGSSCGWLASADDRGQIYLINPATGEQHALPHIATIGVIQPCAGDCFCFRIDRLLTARFGCGPPFKDHCWGPDGKGTLTLSAHQMRIWFYRKVVLSASPRPGSYTAMLIPHRIFGAPAFATAEDPAWRLAPSREGIEDAMHHHGQFYSISYSGVVELWVHDAETGTFMSTAVAPRLDVEGSMSSCRKYLAATPRGRLMVVHKYQETFKVHVLGVDEQWKETRNISEID